jgi:phosphatidylglycerophosphate synthase
MIASVIDRHLRDIKEELMTPIASVAGDTVHPTAITLVSGGLGILCAICAALGFYVPGLILWLLNRFLDGLDGTLARFTGRQSDLGAYLDLMFDFIIYALVPISLVSSRPTTAAMVALIGMLAAFYVNAASWLVLSVLLEHRKHNTKTWGELTSLAMPTGLIEGAETVVFYTMFFLFPGDLPLLFGVFGLLVVVTIIQRIGWAVDHL